jgi:hypothetical protein
MCNVEFRLSKLEAPRSVQTKFWSFGQARAMRDLRQGRGLASRINAGSCSLISPCSTVIQTLCMSFPGTDPPARNSVPQPLPPV